MNIKNEVCRVCKLCLTCQCNYDYECKSVAKWIFINLLSRHKNNPIK